MKIWENLTLVSILLNEPKGCNHGLKKVLSEATAVCLFANLSQVSHSIKELHDSGFSITVPGLKEKVFFADLFVHVFDSDRLHEIVTQALPELWERGPYGERPVLMSENYDCRYTDLGRIGTELMGSAKGLDHQLEERLPGDRFSAGRMKSSSSSATIHSEGSQTMFSTALPAIPIRVGPEQVSSAGTGRI